MAMLATMPPPAPATVIVQQGQTMGEIASAHGVSLQSLEDSNPQISNPSSIYVGEIVNLPGHVKSFPVTLTCTATIDASGNLSINDCSSKTAIPGGHPSAKPHSAPPTQQPADDPAQPRQAEPVTGEGAGILPGAEWACIARAESSDNPRSVNSIPGYIGNGGGLYGDLESTWGGYDGYAQPFQAPVSVQNAFNQRLQEESGWSPWIADSCPQKFGNG